MADPTPRLFVSYTAQDLVEHAEVVAAVARGMECVVVDHRDWPANGEPSLAWCREKVRSCDAVIVLVAHRYGWVPTEEEGGDGERSVVWLEVDEAAAQGIFVLPFLVEDRGTWSLDQVEKLDDIVAGERLDRFKEVLRKNICATFGADPRSLEAPVTKAIAALKERLRHVSPPEGPSIAELATAYRRRVEQACRYLELLGLGDQLHVKLPVSEAYVTLRAALPIAFESPRNPGRFHQERLEANAERLERDVPLPEVFERAMTHDRRGVALLGDPGCGKTTAAKHLAWLCADPTQGPVALGLPEDVLPVLLRLRNLRQDRLEEGLEGFLAQELGSVHLSDHSDLSRHLYRHTRLLWILDGLDEVADPGVRARVSRWIDEAARVRTGDRFLVTCRYAGWQGEAVLGPEFQALHVQPLDEQQRAEFVQRWFRAVERQVLGARAVAEARSRADDRARKLTHLLESGDFRVRARLSQMVANPLVLSILCVVYREELDLPRRRAALYARCVEVLLHHWQTAKGMEGMNVEAARAVLQPLAWWMHEQEDRTEAAAGDLAEQAAPRLTAMGIDAPTADGAAFLARACDESGLLVRPAPGRYAFLHLSFQEYLAAAHAAGSPSLARALAERFGQSWWKEPTLLALGLAPEDFAHTFFEAVLARESLDTGFLELCFEDALFTPLAPFLAALGIGPEHRSWLTRLWPLGTRPPGIPVERRALLLRLLVGRRDAPLLEAARALATHPHEALATAARELLLAAGEKPPLEDERIDERTGIVLVRIPAGTFSMGSPEGEKGREAQEGPRHEVAIAGDFWMGKHPVTNAQYGRFLKENPDHRKPHHWDDGNYNQPRQPVVGVSWDDAEAFCRWAGMRLPLEAEWEYACRAGTHTRYWRGDRERDLKRVGWCGENSGPALRPVGLKPANAWGLHDIHGNVWEWCHDAPAKYGARPIRIDPWAERAEPGAGGRVVRGGGWWDNAERCRAAHRGWNHPEDRVRNLGFRVIAPVAEQGPDRDHRR